MRPEVERVVRAVHRVSALLDPIRLQIWDRANLTVTQLRLMGFLYQEPGIGNAELAERMFITRPSVSALLDRLERGGYIRRDISLDDRRSIQIWLTEDGEKAVVQQGRDAGEFTARMIEDLSVDQLTRIAEALECLREVGAHKLASAIMAATEAE
jgi:DNA-binding MarR family transcriptional regulator